MKNTGIYKLTSPENKVYIGRSVKMSYESKVKQGKKINQYSLSGEFIKTYNMLSEAAESIGVTSSAIYLACRGKIKTAAGFKWSYCDN